MSGATGRTRKTQQVLRHAVMDELLEAIRSGTLPQPLSSRTIAERYGISRATAREVMKELQIRGVVEFSKGKAASVHAPVGYPGGRWPPTAELNQENILEARLAFEPFLAMFVCKTAADSDCQLLLHKTAQAARPGSPNADNLQQFHRSLADLVPSGFMQQLARWLAELPDFEWSDNHARLVRKDEAYATLIFREHLAIARAIAARSSAGTRLAMGQHLQRLWLQAHTHL